MSSMAGLAPPTIVLFVDGSTANKKDITRMVQQKFGIKTGDASASAGLKIYAAHTADPTTDSGKLRKKNTDIILEAEEGMGYYSSAIQYSVYFKVH